MPLSVMTVLCPFVSTTIVVTGVYNVCACVCVRMCKHEVKVMSQLMIEVQ